MGVIGIDVYVVWFGFDVSCEVVVGGVCVGVVFDDGLVGGGVVLFGLVFVVVVGCLLGCGCDCVGIVRGLSCGGFLLWVFCFDWCRWLVYEKAPQCAGLLCGGVSSVGFRRGR